MAFEIVHQARANFQKTPQFSLSVGLNASKSETAKFSISQELGRLLKVEKYNCFTLLEDQDGSKIMVQFEKDSQATTSRAFSTKGEGHISFTSVMSAFSEKTQQRLRASENIYLPFQITGKQGDAIVVTLRQ